MEWIRLEDKKPPENEWLLGAYRSNIEKGRWYEEENAFFLVDCGFLKFPITHWMLLPEPPETEER